MKFISLRWKLSISFMALIVVFLGLYVWLAKSTFEKDKISYVFESQQRQVAGVAKALNSRIERVIFEAKSIVAGYDPSEQKLSPSTQKLFWENPNLLALSFTNSKDPSVRLALEKTPGLLNSISNMALVSGKPSLRALDGAHFAVAISSVDANAGILTLRVVFKQDDLLQGTITGQTYALLDEAKVVGRNGANTFTDNDIMELAKRKDLTRDLTEERKLGSKVALISSARAQIGNVVVIGLMDQTHVLSALNMLYKRSAIFLAFSFFAGLLASFALSLRLTGNINLLSDSAVRIGRGDFSSVPTIQSNDEVGILARAFRKMSEEIQRLLNDTVEKTRMESELKTARLVQDQLFPRESAYSNGKVRLFGINKTTTECGGDWWFYYQKGNDLYVFLADATGHGIPAALITAAARSLFSFLKDSDYQLSEIAEHWDKAVSECSNNSSYMTAFLLKIQVETGESEWISAGHEPPVLLEMENFRFKSRYLLGEPNFALGERRGSWLVNQLQFNPGDRLLVFTDGLLAIQSPKGDQYSEKRFLKYLEKTLKSAETPEQFVRNIDQHFTEFGAGQALPDDVTFLAVEFKANLPT
jgi:sigma-B regulation protein RsbU (phosphoserine phosphatase)